MGVMNECEGLVIYSKYRKLIEVHKLSTLRMSSAYLLPYHYKQFSGYISCYVRFDNSDMKCADKYTN